MLSVNQIWTVALYESKTLRRSWFFRIFLGFALLIFFFLDLAFFTYTGDGIWYLRAIPASAPYINLLYLNIAQAVVAVFLSSDLLKRDNKMDTTEVIYTMPVSNTEYILGKVLGNVIAFGVVDLLVLIIAFVYNMIAPNMGFNPLAYLYYYLLIPIPTLIFITGLSFVMMTILRNQAITFLILLGLLGVSLFYLKGDYSYLFDQFGLNVPMITSDITGFDNPVLSIGQRLMYFFAGLSLIFLTIGVFRRLPRSGNRTLAPYLFAAGFAALTILTGILYTNNLVKGVNYREKLIGINNEYSKTPVLRPISYNIKIKQTGNGLEGTCNLTVSNSNSENISASVFRLNPGLKLKEIKIDNNKVEYIRNEHLIIIEKGLNIKTGDSANISFIYSGTIIENAMFLDVDESRRKIANSEFYRLGRRSVYLTKKYILLTPEAEWYPQPGVSFCTNSNTWYKKWFSYFSLNVETNDSLFAISQGEVQRTGNIFSFKPEVKLPALTLVIGNFITKSFQKDSLSFSVYFHPGHDYFKGMFEKIKPDTIETIFRNRFADYSRKVMLVYPFKRFSIVETPIHYISYQRPWSGSMENTQPELLLVPEKGATIENADFKRTINRIKRWGSYSGEGKLSDQEIEVRAIDRFVESFTKTTISANNDDESGQIQNVNNPYNLFPMFYDSRFYLESPEYPIIDRCLQSFFKNQGKKQPTNFWEINRLTDSERANKKLKESSFAEILKNRQDFALVDRVVNMKGEMLFSIIQSVAGELTFKHYITDLINNNSFNNYEFNLFKNNVSKAFNIQMDAFLNVWFNGKQIPGYQITNVKAEKVRDIDRLRTQVSFRVKNTESTDGIIQVKFTLSDKNQPGTLNTEPETYIKTVLLKANETKDITCILYKEPRSVSFNTMVSKNIPSVITLTLSDIKESPNGKLHEGEIVVKEDINANEIVVDNEDSLFTVIQPATSGILPNFLDNFRDNKNDEYSWFRWWRAPINWKKSIGSTYYGNNVLSIHYCRSGEGERKAIWSPKLEKSGFYEVYYHVYIPDEEYIKNNILGEYRFLIVHDDGTDNPVLDLRNAETGWTHLGTYFFSAGSSPRVELSNKTTAKMVIADAVKFIKID